MTTLAIEPSSNSTNIRNKRAKGKSQAAITSSMYSGVVGILLALHAGQIITHVSQQTTDSHLAVIHLEEPQPADIRSIERILNQSYNSDYATSNSIEISTVETLVESIGSTSKEEYISLAEAQILARKIHADMEERSMRARLAEAEYWKFLDSDDEE